PCRGFHRLFARRLPPAPAFCTGLDFQPLHSQTNLSVYLPSLSSETDLPRNSPLSESVTIGNRQRGVNREWTQMHAKNTRKGAHSRPGKFLTARSSPGRVGGLPDGEARVRMLS